MLHPAVARPEISLEGLDGETGIWKEIPFLFKPTDVNQSPPWVAPHQPRLDWQMWCAALGSYHHNPWLIHLVQKLLEGECPEILDLLDSTRYPFKNNPPSMIRATLYDYDFTRWNTSWARALPVPAPATQSQSRSSNSPSQPNNIDLPQLFILPRASRFINRTDADGGRRISVGAPYWYRSNPRFASY